MAPTRTSKRTRPAPPPRTREDSTSTLFSQRTLAPKSVTSRKRQAPADDPDPAVLPGSRGRRTKPRTAENGADGRLNPLPKLNNVDDDTAATAGTLLVQGEGVQLGMSDDVVEAPKTKLNPLIDALVKGERPAMGERGIMGIAAGAMFSLVVDCIGQVWSFGSNDELSLGREVNDDEATPKLVQHFDNFKPVRVAATDCLALALNAEGQLRQWGMFKTNEGTTGFDGIKSSASYPTPIPAFPRKTEISSIACGSNHVLALTTSGHVYTWGSNRESQLGRKVLSRNRRVDRSYVPEALHLRNIVAIGASSCTSFAVNHKGVVFAWGANNLRQTGISDDRGGEEPVVISPTIVDALAPESHGGSRVVQIEGGSDHTLFLFDNGQVWGCGLVDPQSPRIGLADDHPRMVQALKQIEELAARRDAVQAESGFEAAMEEVPSVKAFIVEPACLAFPPISNELDPVKIKKIASSGRCNLAVDVHGHLYAWGEGNSCQLGLGDTAAAMEVKTPARVKNVVLDQFMAVDTSLGAQHALILAVPRTS